MNEDIILSMAKPYVIDGAITYDEFENIFAILSRKEQYAVVEVLYRNSINLIDKHINENKLVLDIDEDINEDFEEDDFKVLYDNSIFKDKNIFGENYVSINKNIRQSNEILCKLIQQGNRQAIQDLCIKNKRLIDKYVVGYRKRYGNRLDFEDLEQVGFIGLIKAAKRFEMDKNAAFSTYAVWWIKQSISREIMNHGYVIRIPAHMMERINKVVSLDNKLANQDLHIEERIAAIGKEMSLSEKEVKECLILKNNYLTYASLDAPVGEEGESVLGEFLANGDDASIDKSAMKELVTKLERESLESALNTLSEKEQKVLRLRFGLDDGRERTLEEVGSEFNLTRERVRQIEAKALRKLRHPSRSRKLKDYLD